MSEEIKPTIYRKLLNVIASADKVKKSGFNSHQNYHYVMEADLLEAVKGSILEQGILITTSVEELVHEGKLTTVKTKHELIDVDSGEKITTYAYGQGSDSQDKGSAKAITNSVKYFYMKFFMTCSDNDVEDDGGKKSTVKAEKVNSTPQKDFNKPRTSFSNRSA